MKIKLYQVDAFAKRVFEGNPAAICPLEQWPEDRLLQSIAGENYLPETAFFIPTEAGYHIRWFTPKAEVDLCGHATLAAAFVLYEHLGYKGDTISFQSKSGDLSVSRKGRRLVMNFPAQPPLDCPAPDALVEGLGRRPLEVLRSDDYLAVYEKEDDIRAISPDFEKLTEIDLRGVIVTAKGRSVDFVSRFFAPKLGIKEDPVTGSAHCELTPYWSPRLGKKSLKARQLSERGGDLHCEMSGDRVLISGTAVSYMEAEITV